MSGPGPVDGATEPRHVPVMVAEIVQILATGALEPPRRIIDLTLGMAGHSMALLEAAPEAELLGLDRDPAALALAAERLAAFGGRAHLVHAPFSRLGAELDRLGWTHVDAVLGDLGVSSLQLDDPARGFSFRTEGSLDMRMDPTCGETASELLARLSEEDLAALLRDLGGEPPARSRSIARSIARAAALPQTTRELRERIANGVGSRSARSHDPATLGFQALRIAVNQELRELDEVLVALPGRLARGARVAFLAYHSLEDRRIKHAVRAWTASCICPPSLPICRCGGRPRAVRLTRGAQRPSEAETRRNPRARSARLRAVEWVDES